MTSRDYALIAARAADAKKGTDIMVQEVADLLEVTDYFVIVTAMNRPQVESIVEAVRLALKKEAGLVPIGVEGYDQAQWVLLDFGSIVVHIFQPDIRDFYRLETLWGDAPIVDLEAAGITDQVYSERIARLTSSGEEN